MNDPTLEPLRHGAAFDPERGVRIRTLEARVFVPRPRPELFEFFSRAENLGAITPPELGFEIRSSLPVVMRTGARIEYRIRLFGVPMAWHTRISEWNPPQRFRDLQLRGPYACWHHTHEFEESPGGTWIADRVDYRLPFEPWGALAAPLVRAQLGRIFGYRRRVILERFGEPARPAQRSGSSAAG